MRCRRAGTMRTVIGLMMVGLLAGAPDATAQIPAGWWEGFGHTRATGFDGVPRVAETTGSSVFVGGEFVAVDGVVASSIVERRSGCWWPLGGGVDGEVSTLAASGERLAAGGAFLDPVGNRNVGLWDGNSWLPLEGGRGDVVTDVGWVAGELVTVGVRAGLGGGADGPSISRWDGLAWHDIEPPGAHDLLAVVGVGDQLVVAGDGVLDRLGSDGWQPIVVDVNLPIVWTDLASDGDRLVASGYVITGAGISSPVFGDGNRDRLVVRAAGNGRIEHIRLIEGTVYLVGPFTNFQGVRGPVVTWKLSSLASSGVQLDGPVHDIAMEDGEMMILGDFSLVDAAAPDALPSTGIGCWKDGAWLPRLAGIGGVDGFVSVLAPTDRMMIVGGSFTTAGGHPASRVAGVTEYGWIPFGSGVNDEVWAATPFEGDVVIGGGFTEAGGASAHRVARWTGTAWEPMGDGFDLPVFALQVFRGELYATGAFRSSGSREVRHVARWDGSEWQPLGSGLDSWGRCFVVHDDHLAVGGYFDHAGGIPASKVALWDGATWSRLVIDFPVYASVLSMADFQGRLILGGQFPEIGERYAGNLIAYQDAGWSIVGTGVRGTVNSLSTTRTALFISREHGVAGEYTDGRILYWNGQLLGTVGGDASTVGGFLGSVTLATGVLHDKLYVGGNFRRAGTVAAMSIARWDRFDWLVPIELLNIRANWAHDGVQLRWTVSGDDGSLLGLSIHRQVADAEPVALTPELLSIDGPSVYLDIHPPTDTPRYWIQEVHRSGEARWHGPIIPAGEGSRLLAPLRVTVQPSPFRSYTTVSLELSDDRVCHVMILDILGRRVRTLHEGPMTSGRHEIVWDGCSDGGQAMAAGVYLLRTMAGDDIKDVRVVRLK